MANTAVLSRAATSFRPSCRLVAFRPVSGLARSQTRSRFRFWGLGVGPRGLLWPIRNAAGDASCTGASPSCSRYRSFQWRVGCRSFDFLYSSASRSSCGSRVCYEFL